MIATPKPFADFGGQNSAYRPVLKCAANFYAISSRCSPASRDVSVSRHQENLRMANRKGVFIGAYVPAELKRALQQRAVSEHRTLSQEITRILDRKSTRLNSSHSQISYAVFCLKK